MSNTRKVDDIDLQILGVLQENARLSTAEIARRIDLAASAVHERIKKLEARGVIRGYSVDLDPEALGLGLTAFLFVKSNDRLGDYRTAEALSEVPQVLEVHHIAGDHCFLLKVKERSNGDLGRLLREKLGAIPSVRSSRTTIVLETVKEIAKLPMPQLGESTE